jgi:hypothetical protein
MSQPHREPGSAGYRRLDSAVWLALPRDLQAFALSPEFRAEISGCSAFQILADDLAFERERLDALVEQQQRKPKRRRRLSLAAALKQAERAGKPVASVTVDGVTLNFGTPAASDDAKPESDDYWIRAIERMTKQ